MDIIVTAGNDSCDIDALACIIACVELLKLEGKCAVGVVVGEFTASVTPSILKWADGAYDRDYISDGSEQFILVDMSESWRIPSFVDQEKIIEVFDHRPTHQDYWKEKLGNQSHIEIIAACGTLIWEEFKKREKADQISEYSAKLLLASIVSNSLNFKYPATSEKDRNAYKELKEVTKLPDKWIGEYYKEQEGILLGDLKNYLLADTKIFKGNAGNLVIGQIELWNAKEVIEKRSAELDEAMSKYEPLPWIANIADIEKGFNYVYSKNEDGKKIIEEKVGLHFDGDIAKTEGFLPRKYIMKKLSD
jgi:inorganic pyrophosphatase/exopolyphosphatase